MTCSIGRYLADRIQQVGVKDYFAIPGDYNLVLLDELLKNKSLRMINCCNELNAGYAADGYARENGVGVIVVTYSVGGLSCINAVAGAYAENLPVIVISGGPNTNSYQDNEVLHHALGKVEYSYVRNMYEHVTAYSVIVHDVGSAPYQIDYAFEMALQSKKPVYIEIACNIADAAVAPPTRRALEIESYTDPTALRDAVQSAATLLNNAVKPVVVAGSLIRPAKAGRLIEALSTRTHYALANMPDAKGFIAETHKNYIGTYWGPVSSPGCGEVVESSDCYLFVGPRFTDYTTVGHSAHLSRKKMLIVYPTAVNIAGKVHTSINMRDFLQALTKKLKPNNKSLEIYRRIAGHAPLLNEIFKSNSMITTRYLFAEIQQMLNANTAVLAETGDSWFNGLKLSLPKGAQFEIQMQYGSIGWSVGALLGYQLALENKKRVIGLIGDGSFQMSAQEISTMIRYNLAPIIFLMNNNSYTIEVQIHDGPYNVIKNWNYADLVKVFNAEDGRGWSTTVQTCGELKRAIAQAKQKKCLCFIEVLLDKDDCNKILLEWGSRVASNNSRPPRHSSNL